MIAMSHAKTVYTMEIGTCYETTFFFPLKSPFINLSLSVTVKAVFAL